MPFFLFVLGEVADTITTHYGLAAGFREMNPLVANLATAHGFMGLILFKMGACLVELGIFVLISPRVTPRDRRLAMLGAATVAWLPALTNFVQLTMLRFLG